MKKLLNYFVLLGTIGFSSLAFANESTESVQNAIQESEESGIDYFYIVPNSEVPFLESNDLQTKDNFEVSSDEPEEEPLIAISPFGTVIPSDSSALYIKGRSMYFHGDYSTYNPIYTDTKFFGSTYYSSQVTNNSYKDLNIEYKTRIRTFYSVNIPAGTTGYVGFNVDSANTKLYVRFDRGMSGSMSFSGSVTGR